MKLIWLLVNCNSLAEADKIGQRILKKRLAGCMDVLPRIVSQYFWPPRSGKIVHQRWIRLRRKSSRGCVLILTTVSKHEKKIHSLVKRHHRDKVPFIASLELKNVNKDYRDWLISELK